MKTLHLTACIAVWLLTGVTAASADLIQNGSFETGDFSGWTIVDEVGPMDVTNQTEFGISAYQGSYYAQMFGSLDELSQTVSDTANQAMKLTFYLADASLGSVGTFLVYWDNNLLLLRSSAATFGWTEYTYTVMGSGSDSLYLIGNQSDSRNFWAIDDVSLVPESLPEPSSLALLIPGLLLIFRSRLQSDWRSGRQHPGAWPFARRPTLDETS